MISRLPVFIGDEVVSFFLRESHQPDNLCYSNSMWEPIPITIHGKYNDYGAVEDFTGKFDDLLVSLVRHNLLEIEQGKNQYHDIPVTKDLLTMEYLYEADHEGRLFLKNTPTPYAPKEKLACRHVVIMKELYDRIMEDHTIDAYVRDENALYGGRTVERTLDDVTANMEEEWQAMRAAYLATIPEMRFHFIDSMRYDEAAPEWITLVPFNGHDSHCVDIRAMDQLMRMDEVASFEFLDELVRFGWLANYISKSRIHWSPQTGAGSQESAMAPYRLLGQFLLDKVAENDFEANR